jgi:uroporphyrinogen-III synthase
MHDKLHGRIVVITRPAGTAAALARRVRALGGVPLLLPGLALRPAADAATARDALRLALCDELLVFTSPAAVRYAAALLPLHTAATVLAVGRGTALMLRRHGVAAPLAPRRQDSEGLLEHSALAELRGRRVALIGAPGGRGVLREQLAARGAQLRELHVYRRVPPRLDRRHVDALLRLPTSAQVLLSSAEALHNLQQALPLPAWTRLCAATAVVSSERLATAARSAGFTRIVIAASAFSADLLDAATATS